MQMLTTAATAAKIGLSESTLRGIVQRGQFVTPVQVAPRRIAFVEAEVDSWLANRPRGSLPAPLSVKQTAAQKQLAKATAGD